MGSFAKNYVANFKIYKFINPKVHFRVVFTIITMLLNSVYAKKMPKDETPLKVQALRSNGAFEITCTFCVKLKY